MFVMEGVLSISAPNLLDQVMDHLQILCDFDKNKCMNKCKEYDIKMTLGLPSEKYIIYLPNFILTK